MFPQHWSCSKETGEGCTHPTPLSSSQTEDVVPGLVPDLIPGTVAASWSNPHHEEGAPDPGGIHGFGHTGANYPFPHFSIHFHLFLLLIPGPFSSISTLSTWDEEQALAAEI